MTIFFTDFVQEINLGDKGTNAHSKNGIDGGKNGKSGIKNSSKFSHGYAHRSGGNGGQSSRNGRTPKSQGGANFIPVYAAGAVNNHHPVHRGAGNSNQNCKGLFTVIATTIISLIHLYFTFKY